MQGFPKLTSMLGSVGRNHSGPSVVTYEGDPSINKTIHGPGKVERRATEGAWEFRMAHFALYI
jgi:hypothetical protein